MAVIYKIIRIGTDQCYVGHSIEQPKRWGEHRRHLNQGRHHSRYLQRAWNKYGEAAFAFEVVEECLDEDRVLREQYYMDAFNSCYNSAPAAGSMAGYRFTDEQRARCGLHRIGAKDSPDKIAARVAAARQYNVDNPYTWITDGTNNLRHPIAKSVPDGWYQSRTFTEEHKAAVLAAAGPRSDEAKAKMRASRLAVIADPVKNQKILDGQRPFSWWTDGTQSMRVDDGEPPPDGWVRGRTPGPGWAKAGRKPGPRAPRNPLLDPTTIAARLFAGAKPVALARELGVSLSGIHHAGNRGGWFAPAERVIPPEQVVKMQAARQVVRDNAPTRIWINDGANNRQIEPSDPIPDGWSVGHALSAEGRASTAAAAKAQFTSEEASRRVSLAWAKPESRAALMASRQEQCWITDGTVSKRAVKSDPVPEGWRRGRVGLYGRAAAKAKASAEQEISDVGHIQSSLL